MVQLIERNTSTTTVIELVADNGPLGPADIAASLAMSQSDVHAYVHTLVHGGYLDRDESGRVATWCAWPRVGF
jgi:DNA-binding IclR family transcriptional regulator